MPQRPVVSVVVPAHNEERNLLPLCDWLIAVLDAAGRSFEIVVVDDASTDGSVRLLRNLAANEPRRITVRPRRWQRGSRPRSARSSSVWMETCSTSRRTFRSCWPRSTRAMTWSTAGARGQRPVANPQDPLPSGST